MIAQGGVLIDLLIPFCRQGGFEGEVCGCQAHVYVLRRRGSGPNLLFQVCNTYRLTFDCPDEATEIAYLDRLGTTPPFPAVINYFLLIPFWPSNKFLELVANEYGPHGSPPTL